MYECPLIVALWLSSFRTKCDTIYDWQREWDREIESDQFNCSINLWARACWQFRQYLYTQNIYSYLHINKHTHARTYIQCASLAGDLLQKKIVAKMNFNRSLLFHTLQQSFYKCLCTQRDGYSASFMWYDCGNCCQLQYI